MMPELYDHGPCKVCGKPFQETRPPFLSLGRNTCRPCYPPIRALTAAELRTRYSRGFERDEYDVNTTLDGYPKPGV